MVAHLLRKCCFCILLFEAGCSTVVPFDYPKTESLALAASQDTRLGERILNWGKTQSDGSGFFMLFQGKDALGARLRLIQQADRTIDAQYFLVKGDRAGSLFARELLLAADRGVRVRFLIDDVFTSASLDPAIASMNSHPNIEIRLFNPVSRRGIQYLNFLIDFKRANRRMHNKSFTVDNAVTIVGGRNIAEEYFSMRPDVEFNDFDVLGIGPIATQVSDAFDLFWNSAQTVPMEAFEKNANGYNFNQLKHTLDEQFEKAQAGVYKEAIGSSYLDDLFAGRIQPFVGSGDVVTDHPEKIENKIDEKYQELAGALRNAVEGAKREIIILTPYFVPGRAGNELFQSLRAKGVRILIITNSLASTNHVAVHSGYAPYRKPLLKVGVELHEIKVDAREEIEPVSPIGLPESFTLHTKALIVDRKLLFVGSFNVDPRSIKINTEMGVFLNVPEAAREFAERVDRALPFYTYRLTYSKPGPIVWRYEGTRDYVIEKFEPDVGALRALSADILRLLPIEEQL